MQKNKHKNWLTERLIIPFPPRLAKTDPFHFVILLCLMPADFILQRL